jgi:glycosyltransferase involved in cell wall biosynthesis
MTTAELHQVVPVLSDRDATGQHTLAVQQALRDRGVRSEVFAVVQASPGRSHPLDAYDRVAGRGATLLYQLSVGSDASEWCLGRPERLVVDYHNMTPAWYFDAWHPGLAAALRQGRRQLAALAPRTSLAIADSAFNAAELVSLGFPEPVVAPVLLDLDEFTGGPSAGRAADGGVTWLCVGRLVPNKGQHDLIAAFAAWSAATGRPGTLRLVGGGPTPAYEDALHSLARELGVAGRVRFEGSVTHDELVAAYRSSDVLVSLSTHEGFCVPVLEAMQAGLPVVAHAAAAVPDTVGDAALLVTSLRPLTVAAAVERVVADDGLRDELIRRGRRRAGDFGLEVSRARFLEALAPVLSS